MTLQVTADGKFFRAPEGRRTLLVCEPRGHDLAELAALGADAVLVPWPVQEGLSGEARRRGLALVCDAGAALRGGTGGHGFAAGVRAGLLMGRAGRRVGVDLWVAHDADVMRGRSLHFMAGALRALGAAGAPVAGPIEDRRAGRAPGVAVVARPAERSEPALADWLAGLQIAARRRPVVVEPGGGEGLAGRLAVVSDLGAAAVVVRGEDLESAREWLAWEARRLESAPQISVLVCAYNAERHLEECLRSLESLAYPRYEVIVADDGSTDRTPEIARRPGVRLLELEHRGLSAARNAAARAAEGEIVAYLDADARAHPDWLDWLWRGFDRLGVDGLSGPNYPFPDAGLQERAVSGAPGAAVPAVNADGSAAHLPGCSMAFRRELVLEVGFEEHLTTSSDDVVFCDAALARGARLAYHPAAAIDHHRRADVAGYLRQQRAYGETIAAEGGGDRIGWDPQQAAAQAPTPWSSRLNPLKRRYVFSGPQEQGLFAERRHGARVAFPLRLARVLATGWAALLPLAWIARRRGSWARGVALSFAALFAWVAALVPAFRTPRGPLGVVQRLLTAALWFAQPLARAAGERRGARG